jgi:hypothetical protein
MYWVAMRSIPALLLLAIGGCSSMAGLPAPEVGAQPDQAHLNAGLATAVSDSHFAKPIEVSDVFRAQPSSTQPWMVCIRSATSDEARHLTYSAFFGTSEGKDGQYIASRYSVFADNCEGQTYHPYVDAGSPSPARSPSPISEPKKHHRHSQ